MSRGIFPYAIIIPAMRNKLNGPELTNGWTGHAVSASYLCGKSMDFLVLSFDQGPIV